jgi:hypothetical protein
MRFSIIAVVIRPVNKSYYLQSMQTQFFLDFNTPDGIKVHFCELEDIASIQPELPPKNTAVFELDGAAIHSREKLFRAFALTFGK